MSLLHRCIFLFWKFSYESSRCYQSPAVQCSITPRAESRTQMLT